MKDWTYPAQDRNRWHFHAADYVSYFTGPVGGASTGGGGGGGGGGISAVTLPDPFAPIVLAGDVYTCTTNSASAGGASGPITVTFSNGNYSTSGGDNLPGTLTFLRFGVGPAKITEDIKTLKLYWTDGNGNERAFAPILAGGCLQSSSYRGLPVATYQYDQYNRLASIQDRDNRTVVTLAYNDQQQLPTYGRNPNPATATDLTGRQVQYAYDSNGRLVGVVDVLGNTTSYTYDANGQVTIKRAHLAVNGSDSSQDHVETITYDSFNSGTSGAPPSPPTLSAVASGGGGGGAVGALALYQGQVVDVKHNTGEETAFEYQYHGDTDQTYYAKTVTKEGVTTEYTYDQNGNLISKLINGVQVYSWKGTSTTQIVTTGPGQQTTEEYDTSGNLIRRTYPDQTTETWQYDPTVNKLSQYTNQLGIVTTYTYDSLGNELTKTEAAGTQQQRVTTKEYYPNSTLLQTVTYPATIASPNGHRISYNYDSENNIILEFDPDNLAHQTVYTYDALGRKLSKVDPLGVETDYTYDVAGHILTETNVPLQETKVYTYQGDHAVQIETGRTPTAPGRIVRYTYDSNGKVLAIKRVDSGGNETVFTSYTYDSDGRMISETNALGQTATYGYDAYGNRSTISYPDDTGGQANSTLTYDAFGHVTQGFDPVGNESTVQYDLNDRISVSTEAVGTTVERSTTLTYDPVGRVIQTKYKDDNNPSQTFATTYTYDLLGRQTSVGGDRQYPVTYKYDNGDKPISSTDALGHVTAYTYNAYGWLMSVSLEGVTTASNTYDADGHCVQTTDGDGNSRYFNYDALGRVTAESVPFPASQTASANWWQQPANVLVAYTYDAWGETIGTTRYTVDSGGNAHTATTACVYDSFGRKTSETDSGGLTVTYQYDATDKLVKAIYPPVPSSGQTLSTEETFVRSSYNSDLVDAKVDRSGHTTYYTYDEYFRVVGTTNPLGGVTSIAFDPLGRIAQQTDPASNTTTYVYDIFNQPVKITNPDNVPVTHERIEQMTYDRFGNLLTKTGAGGYPITYLYDAVGNRVSMTDANSHVTVWTYNHFDLVATRTLPTDDGKGETWAYTYDNAGRLQSRLDPLGRTTQYAYNAYGQLSKIDYGSNAAIQPVTFGYDQQGRRISMNDGSGDTAWTYDDAGRPATETQGRSHRTITDTYDVSSERIAMDVDSTDNPGNPWHTAYGYDNAGRLSTVFDSRLPASTAPGITQGTFVYAYNSQSDLVQSILAPSGATINKTYDALGRLITLNGQGPVGGTVNSFSYNYGSDGNVSTENTPAANKTYTYDANYQLSDQTATGSAAAHYTYTYDGIGNRVASTGTDSTSGNSSSVNYTTNSTNQYTAVATTLNSQLSNTNPIYDANGNTTNLGGSMLAYDEENRLIEASAAGHTSTYVYDGLGRRVERDESVNGSTTSVTHFVYDGSCVVEELDSGFNSVRSYTRGLDLSNTRQGAGGVGGLLAMAQPAASGGGWTAATYFSDRQGNVTDLVDFGGSNVAHYAYDPFGGRVSAGGAWADVNPYQFSSKEYESAWGLYYYGHRFYNPTLGRWLSADPLQESGGLNLYGFVSNNPLNSIDPAGLFSWGGVAQFGVLTAATIFIPGFGEAMMIYQIAHTAHEWFDPCVSQRQKTIDTLINVGILVGGQLIGDALEAGAADQAAYNEIQNEAAAAQESAAAEEQAAAAAEQEQAATQEATSQQAAEEQATAEQQASEQQATQETQSAEDAQTQETASTEAASKEAVTEDGPTADANAAEQTKIAEETVPAAETPSVNESTPAAESKQLALPAPRGTNPWVPGETPAAMPAPAGTRIQMAMSPGQLRPGGWGTFDNIPDVSFVRNDLAVTPEFKPEVGFVQTFIVPEGTQIQVGTVGPQEFNGITYPGGGNQVQILNYSDRALLIPDGPPRPIQ